MIENDEPKDKDSPEQKYSNEVLNTLFGQVLATQGMLTQ